MKKGCLIVGGGTLLIAEVLGYFLWDFVRIRDWGIGVDSVEWLPADASEIIFISSDINKVAEFKIDRASFERWCELIGKPLRPVTATERANIWRANQFLERLGAIEKPAASKSFGWEEEYAWHYKTFGEGDLFYEDRWPNSGGYAIGYDVKEGRGYYAYAHH